MVKVGGQDFRVAGILTIEPDRMSGSFNVGPRVLISREGLERTGLLRLGAARPIACSSGWTRERRQWQSSGKT